MPIIVTFFYNPSHLMRWLGLKPFKFLVNPYFLKTGVLGLSAPVAVPGCQDRHCSLDPAPRWLVKQAAGLLAPVVAAICNASLQSSTLPVSQKQALVTPRLKKQFLSPDDLNNYRPISNLSFISKVVESAVATQFTTHCELGILRWCHLCKQ